MERNDSSSQWILLVAVFVIATCGLVYELVAGTQASYLLGDSVTQFSTIIGVYLFSMGIGSFLSKYFQTDLLQWFIRIELLVGLIGGFSSTLLFLAFPLASSFRVLLYTLVGLTGVLVGLEIPLLMRILRDKLEFKELVSRVFTFDYIGALLASLIFPLLLVPKLGLIRTSLFFGLLNLGIALYLIHFFRSELKRRVALRFTGILLILAELFTFIYSEEIMGYAETMTFNDNIVYAKSSPYQRIVLTRNRRETRLFLNGNLQFSSADEYRYHEALVHPALSILDSPKNILVLGGGDGLALREILRYPTIQTVTLVDLDPTITNLFKEQEVLTQLNHASLKDPKVTVINADAFTWLRNNSREFDAAIIDFPDPSNYSIGKLYSTLFYRSLFKSLRSSGTAVIQSTSPLVAPNSFWCIDSTLRSVGFITLPYHNFVPSFGEWGYILVEKEWKEVVSPWYPEGLKYLNDETLVPMFIFPEDMRAKKALSVNRLNNQALVGYFEEEWGRVSD